MAQAAVAEAEAQAEAEAVQSLLDTKHIETQFYDDSSERVEIVKLCDFEHKMFRVIYYNKLDKQYYISSSYIKDTIMISGSKLYIRSRNKPVVLSNETVTIDLAFNSYLVATIRRNKDSFADNQNFIKLLQFMQTNDWKLPFLENLINTHMVLL